MAKYAYVSSVVGTNTSTDTSFSAYQADAFGSGALTAANCYAKLQDALSNVTFSDGDEICFDSAHVETTTTHTTFIIPASMTLISMDTNNGSVYKYGAEINGYDGNDQINFSAINKLVNYIGLNVNAGDDQYFRGTNSRHMVDDCRLHAKAGNYMGASDDRVGIYIKNSTLAGNTNFYLRGRDGGIISINNCTITRPTKTVSWIQTDAGGNQVIIENTDLTGAVNATVALVKQAGNPCTVRLIRAKSNTDQVLVDSGSDNNTNMDIKAYSVDNGSGYHYFEETGTLGQVKENTSVYRTGGSYYKDGAPTTSNFSAQFNPRDTVNPYSKPLEFKIAELEMDLTSINTLTFQLAFGDDSSAIDTFTNADSWIKLVQNDGTTLALGDVIESKPATITTTPTDLTSSSETWTGLTHTNTDKREIAIDTTAVSGMTNGQVTAYLCIAKYVSTLEIFGCAKPDIT